MNTQRMQGVTFGKPMERSSFYIYIAYLVGFFVNIFRSYPDGVVPWCYRIICALFGGLILAPLLASVSTWFATHLSWLGFLDASKDLSVLYFISTISVMFGEPIISFLHTVKDDVLRLLRNNLRRFMRIDGRETPTTENSAIR